MRFIIAGCGSMGRRRARHAHDVAGALVGVYDLRDDRLDEIAALHPGVVRLSGPEAFAGFRPDAIFICVPPAEHEFYIDWAIEAGVGFMVEQPVSHRLINLDRILEGVETKRLVAHVSNNHRFSAEVAAMARVIQAGEIGRVLTGIVERGEWLPDWHPYEPYTDYYPSKLAMGGGLDAICDFAWLRHLFGEPRAAKSLFAKKSDLAIDTCDVVQILVDFRDGPQIVLHTDMIQRPYAGMVKLVFERGVVTHTAPEPVLRLYSADTRAWRNIPLDDGRERHGSMQGKADFNFVEPMYARDSAYFIDKLRRRDAATDSLRDGIANLRVIHPLAGGI